MDQFQPAFKNICAVVEGQFATHIRAQGIFLPAAEAQIRARGEAEHGQTVPFPHTEGPVLHRVAGSEAVLQFRRPERGIGGHIDKMLTVVRIYIHKQGDAVFVAATAGAAQGGGKTVRPVGRIVAEHRGRSSIRKGRKTQSQNSCSPEGEEIEGGFGENVHPAQVQTQICRGLAFRRGGQGSETELSATQVYAVIRGSDSRMRDAGGEAAGAATPLETEACGRSEQSAAFS